jgi:WD40 repeat protein
MSLTNAAAEPVDRYGDPLPAGAVQRLGTLSLRYGGVGGLAYLPDGRGVVLTGGQVDLWDLDAGKRLSRTVVSPTTLVSVQVRRDGRVLLLGDIEGTVREWDPATLAEIRSWPTGQTQLRTACYSPDETRMLTAANSVPQLKEWDLATGRELIALTSKLVVVRAGAIYGPGGLTAILGGGYDHNLERWDLTTGELLKTWCTIYEAKHMALAPDEKSLTVGVEDRALEWSLETYQVLRNYKHCPGEAARIFQVAYLPATDEVLCGGRDGTIHRWSRTSGERVFSWRPHQSVVAPLAVSPDEQWVLSYGTGQIAETAIKTGLPRRPLDRHEGSIEAAAFVPGTSQVVTASSDETLRVWDTTTGQTQRVLRGAALGAYAVAVSADGQRVAAGCKDGQVRLYSLADGKLQQELSGHLGYVRAVCFDRAGRLYSSADDGSIRLWDPGQAEAVAVLQGHRGGVLGLDVTPDGKWLASGGRDGTVRLWDLTTRQQTQRWEGHAGWVTAVCLTPDGKYVLSGGRDGRIRQGNLATGQAERVLNRGIYVTDLACSPDSRTVFASAHDVRVKAFDLTTGQPAGDFGPHTNTTLCVAVSSDGQLMLSGSLDTTALLWSLQAEGK